MQERDNLNQWLDDPNILQSRKIFPVIKYSKLWFEWGVLSKQYKYTDNAAATNIAGFYFYRALWPERNCPGDVPLPCGVWVRWVPSATVHWLFSRQKLWDCSQQAGYHRRKVGCDVCYRGNNLTSAKRGAVMLNICTVVLKAFAKNMK